jgi:hypothetical protein
MVRSPSLSAEQRRAVHSALRRAAVELNAQILFVVEKGLPEALKRGACA